MVGVDGAAGRPLASPESGTVTYGLAEFAAAEELDRHRGHWWSPDSDRLLVERADVAPVPVWHVGDPAHPDRAPAEHRYPVAGAANAEVTLWLVGLDGGRAEVLWDRAAFEYLAAVSWNARATRWCRCCPAGRTARRCWPST